ncbi:MAG TPA: ACP S-malonyltransferase [Solirubrobacteraceae bacterium]|nr:ACP S-malonyltransferase [Solirubrobacteraceae bacterium]
MTAFLFPGQGSTTPDMRDQVAALRPDLLDAVAEAVGEDPFPRADESTRFGQPAILVTTLARWSALADRHGEAECLLGHSLGELSALAAAGSIGERQALELVAIRAALMDDAGAPGDGMLAVVGGEIDDVRRIAAAHGVAVANDNSPGQVVLAGHGDDLDAAAAAAKEAGLRTIRLNVTGAFHSPRMAAAQAPWDEALARVEFAPPAIPVLSCLTGEPIEDPRAALSAGLTNPVRFRESLLALAARGVTGFAEVGPGKVLLGLARRTLPDAEVSVAEVAQLV